MNNVVLGMVRQWQTLFYDKHYSNSVLDRKTDFAALARAFGAQGEEVSTPEELDKALKRAFENDGDVISINIPENAIELKIDKTEFDERMKNFVPKKKELSGYLKRYASLVSGGAKGAILN